MGLIQAVVAISLFLGLASAAHAGKRVALLVGNNEYRTVPALKTAAPDAAALAEKLRGLGFEPVVAVNADKAALDAAIADFIGEAKGADLALFYYAGHSVAQDGDNFMLGVEVDNSPGKIAASAVSLASVVDSMVAAARVSLILHDASRTPAEQRISPVVDEPKGDSAANASGEMLIAFSTAPGSVSLDGEDGSPFAKALQKHLGAGADIEAELSDVRFEVYKTTGGRQSVWYHSSLVAPVVLGETGQ